MGAEWLRWRIAILLDKLPGQCWADLVWWARPLRPELRSPWSPQTSTCRTDRDTCGVCYCGKLRTPDGKPVAR